MSYRIRKLGLALLVSVSVLPFSSAFARQPQVQDVEKALLSLTDSVEQQLFFYPNWGTDFLKPGTNHGSESKLSESYKSPQPFYNKRNNMDGGIVAYNGHIFVDAYFRDQRFQNPNPKYSSAELAQMQPWFRWDDQANVYRKEYGGSQMMLMQNFVGPDGRVKLYRGANLKNVKNLVALKNGDKSVLKSLFGTKSNGQFFTPDLDAAKRWATGYVVEISVTPEMLMKSYVGIEYDYLEICLCEEDVLTSAVQTVQAYAYQKPADSPREDGSTGTGGVDSPD
ncbi:MAG: hypothetical protein J7501_07930 [Bdellovibrio sp.]|nr:hypothetical protein [Bdellovibrio sp.]